jgi:nucleotide-binding universal stress UspA family protein
MKTILVPTDFSKISYNAINYAVEIAKLSKAKIVLFHVYHVPVVASEVPIMMPSLHEIEKECMSRLEKIQRDIFKKNGNKLMIECKCECGFAVDEINLFSEKNNIYLIVMGMQGAGYLSEKVIGSITTSLIRKAKFPVLIINEKVKFKNIKSIVLACDYLEMRNKLVLEPLKEFVKIFKSHVYVLNIIRELETMPTLNEAMEGIKLEHLLEDIDHTFHFAQNEDIADGINEFVSKQKIDMVVMIPHTHSALKNIFQEPQTKRLAFHTDVAILTLPE